MKAPPNYGSSYTQRFGKIFSQLAEQYKVPLVPFLLEGVAGLSQWNQADGLHPNAEGQKRMAELLLPYVWKELDVRS
jgi:acyl-CoA thioesterase-1